MSISRVPELVARLYEVVDEFERLFPGRKFTLDGHLVGSIGEVVAAHRYGLELLPASAQAHDATAPDGRRVQIKASQGRTVGLREEPQHLLVLHLGRGGQVTEIYNGPGRPAWEAAGRMQRNGQRAISFSRLRVLMEELPSGQSLSVVA